MAGLRWRCLGMNLTAGAARLLLAGLCICIALLGSCGVEASALCHAEQHPDGTTSYILDESLVSCKEYNWLVSGFVVANEKRINHTVVYSVEPGRITMITCHRDVAYRNSCTGIRTDCSYDCPENSSLRSNSSSRAVSVVGPVAGALLLLMFITQ